MTKLNTAAVVEMSVSVGVLTIDGTRRMSHRFFEQIPTGSFLDDTGTLADDARCWGYVCDGGRTIIVGTVAGELIRMDLHDAVRIVTESISMPSFPQPRQGGDAAAWEAYWDATAPREEAAEQSFAALIDALPQLYIGG